MVKKLIPVPASQIDHAVPHLVIAQMLQKTQTEMPLLIAVGGPGGTGKSTFAAQLAETLGDAAVLGLDDYKTPREVRARKNIFGPHPEANELDLIRSHLSRLRWNEPIEKPLYCAEKGAIHTFHTFFPKRFVVVEGEIATYDAFRDQIDVSIFIDAHWKTQLQTRITRDIEQRGYTPEKAIATFLHSNLREFSEYGAPSKAWSDIQLYCDADYSLRIEAVSAQLCGFLD